MKILYVSYTGLLEPLGRSQVLEYLKKLAPGKQIFLISYEKSEDWKDLPRRLQLTSEITKAGIRWYPLTYHKWPSLLASSYDLVMGLVVAFYLAIANKIEIVHTRSYLPAVFGILLKRLLNLRFIFDMRGFWADERVLAGSWRVDSSKYRVAKWFERQFLLDADVIVSLTQAGVEEMRRFEYLREREPVFYVIPTCTNLETFHPRDLADAPPPADDTFVLGYVGNTQLWYLFEPVLECFRQLLLLRPAARMFIFTREGQDHVRDLIDRLGAPMERIELKAVQYPLIAEQMRRMTAGIFFLTPDFAQAARAPTRLGEFLATGLPCLTNVAGGDSDRIILEDKVGVVIRDFSPPALAEGVASLLSMCRDTDIRSRCRASAARRFSLEEGIKAYDQIYTGLGSPLWSGLRKVA